MPIITCGEEKFNIPYVNSTSSEYIKDVVKVSDNVDVIIPVPDKYCLVIDTYVKFVEGEKIPIDNKERLFLSFQLCTLFADDHYFKYCAQQVFNNWSDMCVMVYNDFNDDLQWSFFVHSPYSFIPKYLLDNDLFMTQWNKLNQNVTIKVNNGSAIYYNNIESLDDYNSKNIKTYHTVNGKEVGYKKVITYYPNSNIVQTEDYYTGNNKDGLSREWYNNEQHTLRYEGHYVDSERNGLWRQWYNDEQHTLEFEGHYVNGRENGLWRHWYDNDQHTLESEGYYVNGEHYGVWRWWYDDDHHTLESEGHFVDGKRDGPWNDWYDNNQHTLKCEGHFVDDERNGIWKEWYDDDQHTLRYEGQYVDGKRDGHWIELNPNGKVTFDGEYVYGVKQY